jgi:glycosidase
MAQDTPHSYHNLVIYEVYVRNHGPHGTFADVEADLPRIRALGVDILWFMPIHPIGQRNKKGSLGSPYSIADYRAVNPEYGTRADFARLVERAHALGLKIMIDVVYNHTAHDSRLLHEHPEYFHRDEHGQPVTTVPEWSDVIDLKFPNPDLSAYLIETLQDWVRFGVDGFRCDVASIVPLDFWQQARSAVAQVKAGVIWLAESVHASFIAHRHDLGLPGHPDCEIYSAFDLAYDYDIWPIWQATVLGRVPVSRYLEMLRFQDCIYPANYVKMRCVENHDQPRILRLTPGRPQALAWTAFAAFNQGTFLIYGGQEAAADHRPSLFDVDRVAWGSYELQPFLTRLARLKKDPALQAGKFLLMQSQVDSVIQAAWLHPGANLYGVFNTAGAHGSIAVHLSDGSYPDLLSEAQIPVVSGKMALPESAVILRCAEPIPSVPFTCDLLDFNSEMK